MRQGIIRQYMAGDETQHRSFETNVNALSDQAPQSVRMPQCHLHGDQATKGNAHQDGSLNVHLIEKLDQIVDQIGQYETSAQGETIVLAAQIVADDSKMLRQLIHEG